MLSTDEEREDRKREYLRKWRKANREKLREYNKAWREANRERLREQDKKDYAANREKVLEYQKKYRKANADKVLEREKKYRKANREKIREAKRRYYKRHSEKVLEEKRRYYKEHSKKFLKQYKAWREANRERCLEYANENNKRRRGIELKKRRDFGYLPNKENNDAKLRRYTVHLINASRTFMAASALEACEIAAQKHGWTRTAEPETNGNDYCRYVCFSARHDTFYITAKLKGGNK